MKRISNRANIILLLAILISGVAKGQESSFKGMLSAWGAASYSDSWAYQAGGRYIPGFEYQLPLAGKLSFEGEFSASITGSYTHPAGDNYYGKIKPYRMWMKITGTQFEIRAGLQKINFGSASMLRPLMWFDQLDPRDPLQLTDGVYGLLGRYYTLSNINFWAWGLYGNNGTKGWEGFPTRKGNLEFGGRLQFPIPYTEIGISYHNRKSIEPFLPSPELITDTLIINENRIGIDIKADLIVGLWLEAVTTKRKNSLYPDYTNMLTIGADYTFGLGNGLGIKAEHFLYAMSESLFGEASVNKFTAVSVNYPFSLSTSISGIIYYDWSNREFYRFLNLGLSYDRFNYYLMTFWNPDMFKIFDYDKGPGIFNGKGLQFMIVFNY